MTAIDFSALSNMVRDALRASFTDLLATNPGRTFDAFAIFTDDSLQFAHPVANTEEGLTATVCRYHEEVDPQHGITSTRNGMRWSYGDWEFFLDVSAKETLMPATNIASVTLWLFLMTSCAICSGEESGWDYPQSGPSGISVERAGNAGQFRTYYCTSNDATEKVVLWYATRIGLPHDHSLVLAAQKGFSNLGNDQVIKTGYGHDTVERKDHTTMIALLSPKHSHVTFLHRRSFESNQDVTISIATAPDGKTSIAVIEPVVGKR